MWPEYPEFGRGEGPEGVASDKERGAILDPTQRVKH